jgi:hypothetical protein
MKTSEVGISGSSSVYSEKQEQGHATHLKNN